MFYSKDEATNFNADNQRTDDFKSFKHKANLIGNIFLGANGILKMKQLLYHWDI